MQLTLEAQSNIWVDAKTWRRLGKSLKEKEERWVTKWIFSVENVCRLQSLSLPSFLFFFLVTASFLLPVVLLFAAAMCGATGYEPADLYLKRDRQSPACSVFESLVHCQSLFFFISFVSRNSSYTFRSRSFVSFLLRFLCVLFHLVLFRSRSRLRCALLEMLSCRGRVTDSRRSPLALSFESPSLSGAVAQTQPEKSFSYVFFFISFCFPSDWQCCQSYMLKSLLSTVAKNTSSALACVLTFLLLF